MHGISNFSFKPYLCIWEIGQGIQVTIEFIIQTTFELTALTCKFLRVNGKLLIPGCRSSYGAKISHPGGTTKFSSANTNSPQSTRFLAETDLTHFNSYFKVTG